MQQPPLPKRACRSFSPSHGVAGVAALAQAGEVAAEVPAARPLAEVAAERALVPQLRARGRRGPLCERREAALDRGVAGDLGERCEGADPERPVCGHRDAPELFQAADRDELPGREDAVAQAPEEIGAPRVEACVGRAQLPDGLPEGSRADVGEGGKHGSAPSPGEQAEHLHRRDRRPGHADPGGVVDRVGDGGAPSGPWPARPGPWCRWCCTPCRGGRSAGRSSRPGRRARWGPRSRGGWRSAPVRSAGRGRASP